MRAPTPSFPPAAFSVPARTGATSARARRAALGLAGLALAAACGGRGEAGADADDTAATAAARREARSAIAALRDTVPLGPGDARLASEGGAVELILRGDTVRMGIGAMLADSVSRAVDAALDSAGGDVLARMGAQIARSATEAVAKRALAVPVADITAVERKEGGFTLRTRTGGTFNVGTRREGSGDGQDVSGAFDPAAVDRFLAALEARRRALGAADAA